MSEDDVGKNLGGANGNSRNVTDQPEKKSLLKLNISVDRAKILREKHNAVGVASEKTTMKMGNIRTNISIKSSVNNMQDQDSSLRDFNLNNNLSLDKRKASIGQVGLDYEIVREKLAAIKSNSTSKTDASDDVVNPAVSEKSNSVNVTKVEEKSESSKKKHSRLDLLELRENTKWREVEIENDRIRNEKEMGFTVSEKDLKLKAKRQITISDYISVGEFAEKMSVKVGEVIKKLFTMGVMATINQPIDIDTAELVADEFGFEVKRISDSDVEKNLEDSDENVEKLPRAPIVTIIGHVDHGKTSLLDALRSTNIVEKEHGGITQHIGASRVQTKDGRFITFLDTPGHEAFTQMRMRGVNITDVAVLVVAADDGIQDQTIEAISHVKQANIPLIVAVNKIDKDGANPERIKNDLLAHNVIAEDMGGDVMFVNISAKHRINLDALEEAILLQAEMLELKAAIDKMANGVILESKLHKNKGVIATFLVMDGSLKIGDIVVAGTSFGKVKWMHDNKNKNYQVVTPSMAVEVSGLDKAPNGGDKFFVLTSERQAKQIVSYREQKEKTAQAALNMRKPSDFQSESKVKELSVIIKTDVIGSAEAIINSLKKLDNEEVRMKIVYSGAGAITESDVNLAAISNALVIAFNVKGDISTIEKAKGSGVKVVYFSVIYNIVDEVRKIMEGMMDVVKSEKYFGRAEIRQIFKVTKVGKVAGSMVLDGMIKKSNFVRVTRKDEVIYEGKISNLKRFKDDAQEVRMGMEFGISFEKFDEMKDGDKIEAFDVIEERRKL